MQIWVTEISDKYFLFFYSYPRIFQIHVLYCDSSKSFLITFKGLLKRIFSWNYSIICLHSIDEEPLTQVLFPFFVERYPNQDKINDSDRKIKQKE